MGILDREDVAWKRTIAEQITGEEPAVLDFLTKPDMTPTSIASWNIAGQLASMRENEAI